MNPPPLRGTLVASLLGAGYRHVSESEIAMLNHSDIEGFKRLLAETVAWCAPNASLKDPKQSFPYVGNAEYVSRSI